ncbi:MAG TPA: non-ribosomal peptide synthetase [Bryobacteraceae bacterium]|nr:non-ribosomal peptide synthetase [Bryobacteraceae bacterium]
MSLVKNLSIVDSQREDSRTIPELFEEQVRRTPDLTAAICGSDSITYAMLDARANQLARHLKSCGIGSETLVAVALDRSIDLLIGMLAILKVGGAYVPLDLSYPLQRIALLLEDAQAAFVLTTERLRERLPANGIEAICLDRAAAAIASHSAEPFDYMVRSSDLAYVIYTSGSTGRPKGVMVEHRNVSSLFSAMNRILGPEPGVWLAVTSISFDISVLELFWTLASGFLVILHTEGAYTIPAEIRRRGVTHLQCTPSLARMLASDPDSLEALRPLRKLLLGGEALPPALAQRLKGVVSGDIYNMYGPTETTVWSTAFHLGEFTTNVPIGRPVANTYVRILGEGLEPVVPGNPGELFIGGGGVVRGYRNQPDLTAERFLIDPLGGTGRLYRTGDLARLREDGELEFLGRLDFQVKIRGFRIELEEIEAVLEQRPGVRQAIVLAREDRPGDRRLVAYLIAEPDVRPQPSELQAALAELLPDHMVPSKFVFLDAMPLTANGKIDRKALLAPAVLAPATKGAVAASELEGAIAEVWAQALDVERVGLDENFFDLGAHSLLVAEVHGRLREFLALDVSLVELFHYPTVRTLSTHLAGLADLAGIPGSASAQHQGAERAARRRLALHNRTGS